MEEERLGKWLIELHGVTQQGTVLFELHCFNQSVFILSLTNFKHLGLSKRKIVAPLKKKIKHEVISVYWPIT